MCIAILGITPGYTNIEPRRPEGGPDGARDIQCQMQGETCFGAVGFKNNACDSEKQRREIKKKFKSDLDSALKERLDLKAFVFLTNVDLAPTEQEDLKKYARSKAIDHVEIYWRERLRVSLDSPEGYAIRNSFLDIALSDAEQKVFFDRFGKDLQNVISGKLESVEKRIEEIAFQNWCRGKCRSISVQVKLKSLYQYAGTSHEPFRFALRLHRVLMYGDGELVLGCFSKIEQQERFAQYLVAEYVYENTSLLENLEPKTRVFPARQQTVGAGFTSVQFGLALKRSNPLVTEYGIDIEQLKQYVPDFYCDSAWAEKIECVEVWYDHYLVRTFKKGKQCDSVSDVSGIPNWPQEAAEVSDRSTQRWSGYPFVLDRVCKRRPVSAFD